MDENQEAPASNRLALAPAYDPPAFLFQDELDPGLGFRTCPVSVSRAAL
jgi:hypothetical protein